MQLEIGALLTLARVLAYVLLRDGVQLGQQLDPDNSAEWIIRGHQQRAAFSGAEVDESELPEIDWELLHDFMECQGIAGLVGSPGKHLANARAQGDVRPRGVDAVVPVKIKIAVR